MSGFEGVLFFLAGVVVFYLGVLSERFVQRPYRDLAFAVILILKEFMSRITLADTGESSEAQTKGQ